MRKLKFEMTTKLTFRFKNFGSFRPFLRCKFEICYNLNIDINFNILIYVYTVCKRISSPCIHDVTIFVTMSPPSGVVRKASEQTNINAMYV
jgi:hypothetical protein